MKEYLKEYSNLKKEIKSLELRISKLENSKVVSDSVKGTSQYFPYIEKNYKIRGLDLRTQKKIDKLLELLSIRKERLLDIVLEIEKKVDNIKSSRIRLIFQYKYLDNFSWRKIALLIGGTEDSIRKEHDRFLRKVEKNEICPKCPV